jgi:GNAT superfamily N-acetyltransferase
MIAATIRPLADGDSLAELTALLHRAYAPLGAAGLNFTAVDQSEQVTRERIAGGHCLVAVDGDRLVGTATVRGMHDPNRERHARVSPWFFRRDVAHLNQFAVEPRLQGQGVGGRLMAACEHWARAQGHRAIALDTAEPATHLRERYERAGYREVTRLQRDGKRYRSIVMVKPLVEAGPAPHDDDAEHHAAIVRTLWASFEARDWASARTLFADAAHMHWLASGEHLDDADAIIRVNAIYPEGWAITVHEVTGMADGRVHSLVQVDQDGERYFAHSLWRFAAGRIADVHETWATAVAPPAWRTAAAIGAYRQEPFK